jgi:hypothetical protein
LAYYEQQDAHELMIALLDTLCEHLHSNHGDFNIASVKEIADVTDEAAQSRAEGGDMEQACDHESTHQAECKEGTEEAAHEPEHPNIFQFRGIVNEVHMIVDTIVAM